MNEANIAAELHAWEQFFVAGNDTKRVTSLDTVVTLARASGDSYLIAQADLCEALEAAWMNGARQADGEATEAVSLTPREFLNLAAMVCRPVQH